MIAVYHNRNNLFGIVEDPDACRNIEKVAEVNSNSLSEAFRLTNHIESDWTQNPGVEAVPGRHRSTSVGDVMIVDGNRFIVTSNGFQQV